MNKLSVDFGGIIRLPKESYQSTQELKEDFAKVLGVKKEELYKIDIITALDDSYYICWTDGKQRSVYLFDASNVWIVPFHSSEGSQDKIMGVGCSKLCEHRSQCNSDYKKKFP